MLFTYHKNIRHNVFICLFAFFLTGLWIRTSHAQKVSLGTGIGTVQINAKDGQLLSCKKSTLRQIKIGFDLEKKEHPFRFTLQGLLFETGEKTEKWHHTLIPEIVQENSFKTHGMGLDALLYFAPYTYRSWFSFKPFIGGGFVYKHLKLDRKGFKGPMFPLTNQDNISFYISNQRILAIGGMPFIGTFFLIPQKAIEIELNMGLKLLSTKSNSNYRISPSGEDDDYPMTVHSSGYSLIGKFYVQKRWEYFSIALGYEWERMQIDNKSVFFYEFDENRYTLPYPKYEIRNDSFHLTFSYLF